MLQLYYTSVTGEDTPQMNYYNSLGGYRSSDVIKNDDFDNMFGEISIYTVNNNNRNQYIGLVLKNNYSSTKNNIKFWFDRPENCYSKLYIAAIDMLQDEDGKYYMENIKDLHSSPVMAKFYEAEGEDNSVDLGSLSAGQQVGLWIKREILVDNIKSDMEDIVKQDPDNQHRVVLNEKEKEDMIELNFSFD